MLAVLAVVWIGLGIGCAFGMFIAQSVTVQVACFMGTVIWVFASVWVSKLIKTAFP